MGGLEVKGAGFAGVALVALHVGLAQTLGRLLVADLLRRSPDVARTLQAVGIVVSAGRATVARTTLHPLFATENETQFLNLFLFEDLIESSSTWPSRKIRATPTTSFFRKTKRLRPI